MLCQSTFEIGILALLSGLKVLLADNRLGDWVGLAIGVNQEKTVEQPVEEGETQRVYAAAIDMDAGEKFDFTKLRYWRLVKSGYWIRNQYWNLSRLKGNMLRLGSRG